MKEKTNDKPTPKESLQILNSKEKKALNQQIMDQWGCELDKEFVFLLSNKEKLYILDKDMDKIALDNLRVDNMGLYVCTVNDKGVRLSIEGSQIIGPHATKNILEITDAEVKEWLRGNDLHHEPGDCKGFIIIKNKTDFLGCGKVAEKGIMNFVPKARRITSTD
ncbi:MAG: hypothetical protein V1729_06410 [Candidatus Woesearchaeota archaeon]